MIQFLIFCVKYDCQKFFFKLQPRLVCFILFCCNVNVRPTMTEWNSVRRGAMTFASQATGDRSPSKNEIRTFPTVFLKSWQQHNLTLHWSKNIHTISLQWIFYNKDRKVLPIFKASKLLGTFLYLSRCLWLNGLVN